MDMGMERTSTSAGWAGPLIVVLAPAVMLLASVAHPFIAVLPDAEAVARSVQGDTTRWAVAHLLTNAGSALIALAFLAVRALLRDAGEERFSRWGLPFVVLGSVLYGFLPGLEFAPMAAAETGGDVLAVQAALEAWFVPVFVAGALTFAIGASAFARGIAASAVLRVGTTRVVVGALLVMAVARLVPLGVVQFYVQGLAGLVALWPFALVLRRRPEPTAPPHAQASPAATGA